MKWTIFSIGSLIQFCSVKLFAQEEQVPDFASEMGPTLLQLAGALLLIIIIIYASVWVMKRYSTGKSPVAGELIKVVERRHLTPKQAIYVVKVGEKHVLLGATENGINKLCDVEIAPPPAAKIGEAARNSTKFGQFLRQAKESLMPRAAIEQKGVDV